MQKDFISNLKDQGYSQIEPFQEKREFFKATSKKKGKSDIEMKWEKWYQKCFLKVIFSLAFFKMVPKIGNFENEKRQK